MLPDAIPPFNRHYNSMDEAARAIGAVLGWTAGPGGMIVALGARFRGWRRLGRALMLRGVLYQQVPQRKRRGWRVNTAALRRLVREQPQSQEGVQHAAA